MSRIFLGGRAWETRKGEQREEQKDGKEELRTDAGEQKTGRKEQDAAGWNQPVGQCLVHLL